MDRRRRSPRSLRRPTGVPDTNTPRIRTKRRTRPRSAGWGEDWQQLSRNAIDKGMGHYLRGCANVAMAHSLPEAWAALFEAQDTLIRHSAGAFAEAVELWREHGSDRVRS